MNEHRNQRRRYWWLPYLQTLLGIFFIIGCYFGWICGGSGAGSGTGSGTGTGSGSGPDSSRSSGYGSGRGSVTGPSHTPAEVPVVPAKPVAPTPATPAPVSHSSVRQTKSAETPKAKTLSAEEKRAADAPVLFSRQAGNSGSGFVQHGGGGGNSRFYGMTLIRNENVLFLVDVSGSMASHTAEGISRFQVLKRELNRAIRPQPGQKANYGCFFIVAYSDQPEMVPSGRKKPFYFARPDDVEQATRAIEALSCRGGTAMTAAWQGVLTWIRLFEIRRVYFLSDGEPTDDFSVEKFRALRKQTGTRFVVDGIAVGGGSTLLQEIARSSGGRYRVVQ